MIGVTADTNIYVSAFVFAGLPYQLLQAAEDGRIRLSISEPVRQELSRVLQVKFAWSADEVDETMLQLVGCSELAQPTETLDVIANDPADNRSTADVLSPSACNNFRFLR